MKSSLWVQDVALASLRRRWAMMALLYLLTVWLGYQALHAAWRPSLAWGWMLAAAALAYELGVLWRGLKDNHRPGEAVLMPTLGPANLVTLLRGLLLGLLAVFLAAPWPSGGLAWLPALLYTLAIIVDMVDGYVARRSGDVTLLGATLDIEFDALGVLIATGLAVHYGQLPGSYLLLGLSRYLFLFGIWWRRRQGMPIYDMTPSVHRRVVASLHVSFMSVMLWPLMRPPATTLIGLVFALPFIASFTRDWLVVSGRLDPTSSAYLEARRRLAVAVSGWPPVVLRIGVAAVALSLIFPAIGSASERTALFGWPGMPFPQFTAIVISLVALVAAGMLVLGAAGRLAALGVIIAATATIHAGGLGLANGFLLAASIAVLFLGSGAHSCWRPEEAVLFRRAGEKRRPEGSIGSASRGPCIPRALHPEGPASRGLAQSRLALHPEGSKGNGGLPAEGGARREGSQGGLEGKVKEALGR